MIWLSKEDDRILTPQGFTEPSTGGEYKYHLKRHLHVLKLETFLVKPTTSIKLWGNHRDGDKRNNDLDNLEWATSSMNLIHAFENGLRSDNQPGLLIDLSDGSIVSFNSLRDCAMLFGINPGLLTRYLNTDRKYPFRFKFAIRLIGEEPSKLTVNDVGESDKQSPNPLKTTNGKTNEVKYFAFEGSVRKYFGLGYRALKACIKNGCFGDWTFERITTYEEYVMCLEQDAQVLAKAATSGLVAQRNGHIASAKRVVVTNHLTEVETEYESIYTFAQMNQFMIGEINRALKTKDSWREYTFKFLE